MAVYVGDALLSHARGGCYICGRGDSLVDTDVQIVGEGALVICKGCIQDLAEAGGLHLNRTAVAEIEARHAEERRSFAPERVAELEAQVSDLERRLEVAENVERMVEDIKALAKGPQTNRRPRK